MILSYFDFDRYRKNCLDPLAYQLACSLRFKGGSDKARYPIYTNTHDMNYARAELYPMAESGMAGNGFGDPALLSKRKSSMALGIKTAFEETSGVLTSQMKRTVKSGDDRVTAFANNALARNYVTAKDDIRRGFVQEASDDKAMSEALAGDYLSAERHMSVATSDAYNSASAMTMANQQKYGTFGTNIAAGLGSGISDFMYAQKMAQ